MVKSRKIIYLDLLSGCPVSRSLSSGLGLPLGTPWKVHVLFQEPGPGPQIYLLPCIFNLAHGLHVDSSNSECCRGTCNRKSAPGHPLRFGEGTWGGCRVFDYLRRWDWSLRKSWFTSLMRDLRAAHAANALV